MNKKLYRSIQIFILVFIGNTLFGQDEAPDSDLQTWTALTHKLEFNKKWNLKSEAQFRSKANLKEFDHVLSELELTFNPKRFEIIKPLRFSATCRYIGKNDNIGGKQGYENYLRYQAGMTYKTRFGRFAPSAKIRYQYRQQYWMEEDVTVDPTTDWRYKVELEYDIKGWKLDPIISYEIFDHTDDGVHIGFNKYRLRLDTEYRFKNGQRLNCFVTYENSMEEENDYTAYILGIKYRFITKLKKEKNQ